MYMVVMDRFVNRDHRLILSTTHNPQWQGYERSPLENHRGRSLTARPYSSLCDVFLVQIPHIHSCFSRPTAYPQRHRQLYANKPHGPVPFREAARLNLVRRDELDDCYWPAPGLNAEFVHESLRIHKDDFLQPMFDQLDPRTDHRSSKLVCVIFFFFCSFVPFADCIFGHQREAKNARKTGHTDLRGIILHLPADTDNFRIDIVNMMADCKNSTPRASRLPPSGFFCVLQMFEQISARPGPNSSIDPFIGLFLDTRDNKPRLECLHYNFTMQRKQCGSFAAMFDSTMIEPKDAKTPTRNQ